MMRLLTIKAIAKAVSLVERVFMGVSNIMLSSILTCITQQGRCQLQALGKGVIGNSFSTDWVMRVTVDSVRGQDGPATHSGR
jgi:hypothetical protein